MESVNDQSINQSINQASKKQTNKQASKQSLFVSIRCNKTRIKQQQKATTKKNN